MADGFNDSYSGAFFAMAALFAAPLPAAEPDLDQEFGRFYRAQWSRVLRFLQSQGLQPQVAEDLAQEIFVRAYRAFPSFEMKGLPGAETNWVRKIALRLLINWRRDQRGEAGPMPADREGEERFDPPDSAVVDVVRKLISEELQAAVPGQLARLPPGQQEVLRLWIDGKSYEQICAETGKSMQNVKATLHKAKAKLADLVRQHLSPHTARPAS
jgi:RNA polymerase sigma factor (sigma-70 family)